MSKIVIFMSTYNGECYLRDQLSSIAKQSFDGEIVLVVRDDGSSDDTLKIIYEWTEKLNIIVINDGKRLGPANSFWNLINYDIDADYYAFADQDDIWDFDKISIAVNALSKCDLAALWFSNCRLIVEDGTVAHDILNVERPILSVPAQLVCGNAQGCSMIFNHKAIKIVRELKLSRIPMHDIILMISMIVHGRITYDPLPLFGYRIHTNNAVAKEGKSIIGKFLATYKNWFGNAGKYSTSRFAAELLSNNLFVSDYDKCFLKALINCKYNLSNKLFLIKEASQLSNNSNAIRSFRIRVLLGII